ncbi:MAG: tRNA (adenosine(37)-N6)-dimethylallyltransferase MiaA [Deltaproteobacteria bacterium]|nr:tRNA (adenosine(37)-N6)-dimethylallyltransferase MiaA [Deltaproteobacteria bacterium]
MSPDDSKLLILTGPTGVGKSALAVALAERIGGEIVSADSQQVYRECDIGTAKLPLAKRRAIPHHLIDVLAPNEACDAYRYVLLADQAIAAIRARGRVPIVVGGTGLYLKGLVSGLCDAPPRDATLRKNLEMRCHDEGVNTLHAELTRCDPETALQIHPGHSSRIIRALEVFHLTGQSITAFHRVHRGAQPRYPATWIGLMCPRAELRERIAARVAQQLACGWLAEVTRLLEQYGAETPIFRAIGYRELLAHLQQAVPWADTVARIVTATTQYAKRQMTFLRGIPKIAWHDVTDSESIIEIITRQQQAPD